MGNGPFDCRVCRIQVGLDHGDGCAPAFENLGEVREMPIAGIELRRESDGELSRRIANIHSVRKADKDRILIVCIGWLPHEEYACANGGELLDSCGPPFVKDARDHEVG